MVNISSSMVKKTSFSLSSERLSETQSSLVKRKGLNRGKFGKNASNFLPTWYGFRRQSSDPMKTLQDI